MIRGTLSLLAIGTGLLHAAIGDWQAWTNVQSPVMAARSGSGIWTASPGGATRYDTATGKAAIYTSLDGLVSTDLVGILSLKDTLWSTSSRGDLCRLLPGSRTWEPFGSYRQSGWSFNPRVLTSSPDRSVLVLGGDQGLSLYSIANNLALDNITSFGNLANQKVHAVAVTPRAPGAASDTIWVGLQDGAAYAPVPDWSKVGRGNGILSDPSKWTVFRRMSRPVVGLVRWKAKDSMRTLPDSGSTLRLDTARVTVLDTTYFYRTDTLPDSTIQIDTTPYITSRDIIIQPVRMDITRIPVLRDTSWNWASSIDGIPLATGKDSIYEEDSTRSIGVGANHALHFSGSLAISTQGRGLLILRPDNSLKFPPPPSQLPSTPVHHLQLHPDGSLHAWIGKDIYRLPANRSAWTSSLFTPASDKNSGMPANALGQDPNGALLFGTWGSGLWRYDANTSPTLTQFDNNSSCLQPVIPGTGYVVGTAISSPTSEGNWTGFHVRWIDASGNTDSTSTLQIAYLPTNKAPRCFALKELISVSAGGLDPVVTALSAEGDSAVWVAHATAVLRYRIGRESLELAATVPVGNASSIQWLGQRLYAVENGILKYLERIGTTSAWKTVLPSASFLQGRGYRKLDVDTLGNLWASSANGMDILVQDGSTLTLSQRIDQSSGLLSDDIVNFSLDRSSGTVAFATPLGLSLYQSQSKLQPKTLDKNLVRPFPNPYRKFQHSKVAFPSVDSTAELHIYAADGSLVNHQSSKEIVGDQFLWKPASHTRPGIYFWTISDGSSRLMGRLVIGD